MQAAAIAEAVTRLAWLAPSAASLVQLARDAYDWTTVRPDPGCVALVLRATPTTAGSSATFASGLHAPALMTLALEHLDSPGFLDIDHPEVRKVFEAALAYADRASRLAAGIPGIDPEMAWMAGLLSPLGWLGVSAVAPAALADCLAAVPTASLTDEQRRLWGFDQAALGLRLCRRWALPAWLTAVVGHLGLPVDAARRLGAEPSLFLLVQLAVGLEERQQPRLGLPVGTRPVECAAALRLPTTALEAVSLPPTLPDRWHAPQRLPLLRELLQVAAENRRLARSNVFERLEQDCDELVQALQRQYVGEPERLQTQGLTMMAEFAAGAGHEINNPLAVISGQAQYLLSREEDPAREKALRKIIGQTQRIHEILTELMQFARPARPQKREVDLSGLIREAAAALADLAEQRKVRLDCPEPESPLWLVVDGKQIRTALTCLLRNAVEAAPVEGWVSVRLQASRDCVEFLVEDSGPGPTPLQRERMFDPFYSGRQAGRGRGLGLPTAWRFAREHDGDLVCAPGGDGPTRFILRLPRDPGTVEPGSGISLRAG